jgi:DNA-binding PadR family transcriptional regulator
MCSGSRSKSSGWGDAPASSDGLSGDIRTLAQDPAFAYYSTMEYQDRGQGLRGFPVEFAAMGFLVEEPMHGYALRACISEGLGPLWQVASSQLYQVLRRLEDRGWVRRTRQGSSAGPTKRVYHATPEGEGAFWEWATAPVDAMRNVRVEFAAKVYFLRRMNPKAIDALFDRQLAALAPMGRRVLSEDRRGSDDLVLNRAWQELQTATIENFARWLTGHQQELSQKKETG